MIAKSSSSSADPSRLAPQDVYLRSPPTSSTFADAGLNSLSGSRLIAARRTRDQKRNRSRSKRRKGGGIWKKLLWVKQSYPDNYTDEETFLDHLQRNPRLQPYQFWPLVGESTVIVQQVCTMIVFVCCFSGIIQERVSPVTIVTWGTVGTVLGWVLWDAWVGREESLKSKSVSGADESLRGLGLSVPRSESSSRSSDHPQLVRPEVGSIPSRRGSAQLPEPRRGSFIVEQATATTTTAAIASSSQDDELTPPMQKPNPVSGLSTRNQQRLTTMKSALLIYFALLGLSPILKSLTQSTASDSIWAISFWLMSINVIFFDYGGAVGTTFPASLSTNAALMASTVLASRLPSTTHVFSLTLFSIEVFGLFPIFRRYLRHFSWHGHLLLTWVLVMASGGGVSMILSGGAIGAAIFGAFMGTLLTSLAMGLSALWLISLQRHKNAIIGPWDAARPRLNTIQY